MKKNILLAVISLLVSPVFGQLSSDFENLIIKRYTDSTGKEVVVINVPGKPPDNFRMPEVDNFSPTAKILSEVPGYDWSFGCSPTAAAMMAGYYDRTGFINMYSGPTNNGLVPMDNSSWGTVVISGEIRSQCPLSATRMGVDGRTTRGHVDDYWIVYGNPGPDPYIANSWMQHTWEDCTGDFMKTSQSVYGLSDGATRFEYDYNGPPRSSTQDGTYGLKLFFESRGYVVTNYYNQLINGYNGNTVGFTFAHYRQEIDAGRPVLIHISTHTMLGFGYDSVGNKIYLHDTWDYSTHEMTWGGTYGDLQHYGVSVISLQPVPYIVITSPNGGELYQRGTTDTITWNDNIPENIRIEMYKDGIVYDTIAGSVPSSGNYIWTIPPDQTMSTGYQIKITSTANNNLFDFSNSSFSIANIPTITTTPVSNVTHTTGITGGNITFDGGVTVTGRGVCWSTDPFPTILNNHTTNGNGTGVFVSNITGLTSNSTYFIRAYATTNFGTTYANQVSCVTLVAPTCGLITVNHLMSGGVAPVDKTVTYETVAKMSGEPLKCWITSNLGADHQATAVDDATEASAGWYWQFNRKQGYKHDGITRIPNTSWNAAINENLNWEVTKDPCALEIGNGWRLPTSSEWSNVDTLGNWTNWNGPWLSDFKIHAAGRLYYDDGSIGCRGKNGYYWSSAQSGQVGGWYLLSWSEGSLVIYYPKSYGFTVRCIKEALLPTVCTTIISNITPHTSTSGGNITNDGGDPVIARGVCWDTSINPTIAGSHSTDSSGTGIFVSLLTGLAPNTLYFVRAYATNGVGTSYGDLVSFYSGFPCGSTVTINHLAGSVAPVTKTVIYGTVSSIPGEPFKCWIDGNLGADHQATAVNDDSEASAGWYWQFNRKQGYKHSGSILTPSWTINTINEGSDWIVNNDPCAIDLGYGWRIPTSTEWANVDAAGGWSTWDNPWNSALKLHAAGNLNFSNGSLANRGIYGNYRSSKQYNATSGWSLNLSIGACFMENENSKASGFSIRCLRDTGSFISTATVVTTSGSDFGANTATFGGNVTNEGGDTVTVRGICWSTTPNPTLIDDYTANGNGPGVFTGNLTGLNPHTLYFVRAYATNNIGTAYGNEASFYTNCGTLTINHMTNGGVAPVDKTVNYATITNIPGEPSKCWITSNLGADHQATAVNDATEASAGWYWQFNRKQGYKHDGTTRTPNTSWISSINENFNWETANDPCAIELGCGWRLPTYTEWLNVDANGNWTNWYGPWNSGLKLHATGFLNSSNGAVSYRGIEGNYWSLTNGSSSYYGNSFIFSSSYCNLINHIKIEGNSVRCLRENGNAATIPTVSTAQVSGYAADFGTSGGNVTSDGGLGVIFRGVCWSTSSNPTIVGNHTANGGGAGTFISYLTGLTPNTHYYIRAYATNCLGTAYGNEVSFTSADPYCSSFTISHEAGLVAPVSKSVNYGAVTNIPGEPSKCWITSNLGAEHQATAVNDATEASAGWYWQFNRKQGYKHDGTTRLPNTAWITSINENRNWEPANDPCAVEIGNCWRIPTYSEWSNVDGAGSWTDWNGPWNSGLKLHSSGQLNYNTGNLYYRGSNGYYNSNTQSGATGGQILLISSGVSVTVASTKSFGYSVRCVREAGNSTSMPVINTGTASNISGNTAVAGGTVTNDGGTTVYNRGICWSTSPNPSLADDHTCDGTGTGSFSSTLSGLIINTQYYLRAYATNCMGTSYGDEISFLTTNCENSLLTNLISHWKIDETTGSTVYDSYGSNHCTKGSGVTISQPGLINKGASFITNNSGLMTGKTATQLGIAGGSSKSVSIWIKPDTAINTNSGNGIIKLGYTSDQQQFGIKYNGYWMFDSWNGAVRIGSDNNKLADGIWHHIVVTYNSLGNKLRTYLDGNFVTEDVSRILNTTDNHKFSIGIGSQGQFIGAIDEVGLWSRALSDAEVQLLFNNGMGKQSPFGVPSVATLPVSSVASTSATLNGIVNPQGSPTSYHFEWGTTTDYGNYTPTVSAGSGTSPISVYSTLTGLSPESPYHYKLVANYSSGTLCGNDFAFAINQQLSNITIPGGTNSCYGALQTITVAGSGTAFTIQNDGSATLIAGLNILFYPGSLVMNGGYMHAYISPNGPFCTNPTLPTVVASTEKMFEPETWSFRLYPNPTTSNFTLELGQDPSGSPVEIQIYNMMGKVILKRMIHEGINHEFSLETQAPGIYLVKVDHDGVGETRKIIKQ